MYPTAAVSGWYFAHPDAKYFAVGPIDLDQMQHYAARKGWSAGRGAQVADLNLESRAAGSARRSRVNGDIPDFLVTNGTVSAVPAIARSGIASATNGGDNGRHEPAVSFADAIRFWLKLGFISFGGPAGQIAIMHQELVERRRWISEARFLHALNYCMLLPGPEAQQLATYIGWLLHRTWGGLVAGLLFILPSLVILLALSCLYVRYGHLPAVAAFFFGIKPAVVAIVAFAAWRIGGRVIRNAVLARIARCGLCRAGRLLRAVPAGRDRRGAVGGWARVSPRSFETATPAPAASGEGAAVIDDHSATPAHATFSWGGLWVLAVGMLLWLAAMSSLIHRRARTARWRRWAASSARRRW